jgi:CubicO group peptidase (beta-lactamase class C family)
MRFGSLILLLIGSVLLLHATLLRPAWVPGVIDNDLQSVTPLDDATRDWIRTQMRERGIPGLSVAIVIHGEVAAVEAFGVSDAWTRAPVTPDTLFEVASNSKVVTALAAIREMREGRLHLNRPLVSYRDDFSLQGEFASQITLQRLLTHSAALGNRIENTPIADTAPDGRFRYSGQGFELVGQLIAHDTGNDLSEILTDSVLEPLGVSEQATYGQVYDDSRLASPHVPVSRPLIILMLPATLIFLLMALVIWLLGKLRLIDTDVPNLPMLTVGAALLVSLSLPFMLVGTGNALRIVAVDLLFIAATVALITSIRRWAESHAMLPFTFATALAAMLAFALFWHMPVPLEERTVGHPAAAGLRASARDMGQLLAALVDPPRDWRVDVDELTRPRIRVNDENQWGLGIGIQELGDRTTIWHWGVNYPGYQSLMLGVPAENSGVVILMNGSPMMISPEGQRFSGLEFARELAARVLPGPHGAYWHGVQ